MSNRRSICRMCGTKKETVSNIVSDSRCSKLAQNKNKKGHKNVARYVHWQGEKYAPQLRKDTEIIRAHARRCH